MLRDLFACRKYYISLYYIIYSFYETAPQYLSALVTRKDYVKNTRSSTDYSHHYMLVY